MLQDLRFALRLFNRHRGYAATAILTVALGVGANTAVFSVADSVLFRPLPFADAGRLFVLRIGNPKTGETYGTLPGAAVDAARGTGMFDGLAAAPSTARIRAACSGAGASKRWSCRRSRASTRYAGRDADARRIFTPSDAGTRGHLTYRSGCAAMAAIRIAGADPTRPRSTDSANDTIRRCASSVLPARFACRSRMGRTSSSCSKMRRSAARGRRSALVRLRPGVDPAPRGAAENAQGPGEGRHERVAAGAAREEMAGVRTHCCGC